MANSTKRVFGGQEGAVRHHDYDDNHIPTVGEPVGRQIVHGKIKRMTGACAKYADNATTRVDCVNRYAPMSLLLEVMRNAKK